MPLKKLIDIVKAINCENYTYSNVGLSVKYSGHLDIRQMTACLLRFIFFLASVLYWWDKKQRAYCADFPKGDMNMTIHRFSVTSATTLQVSLAVSAPICIFRSRYSNLALDLLRETIGDYGAQNNPDRVDDGRFVIHADIEMDNKNYDVCYIRNADFMGDNRLAVNFKSNSIRLSEDDTREFVDKCNERDTDNSNVLIKTADISSCEDDRPIFIYDFFDRLDEAIDIAPTLDKLSSLGRQVFIAVCANDPIEKLKHDAVQIVHTEADDVED